MSKADCPRHPGKHLAIECPDEDEAVGDLLDAPICDYCDEGNVATGGWHYYVDDSVLGSSYRVPCRNNPPKGV